MNLDIRKAKRNILGLDPGPEEEGPDHVQDTVAGEPGADRGADPAQEAGGAPKAHAGDTPTPETGAGDLEADPETERRRMLGGGGQKRLLKATAQPEGHAV